MFFDLNFSDYLRMKNTFQCSVTFLWQEKSKQNLPHNRRIDVLRCLLWISELQFLHEDDGFLN
jgi:hypothetical protein